MFYILSQLICKINKYLRENIKREHFFLHFIVQVDEAGAKKNSGIDKNALYRCRDVIKLTPRHELFRLNNFLLFLNLLHCKR